MSGCWVTKGEPALLPEGYNFSWMNNTDELRDLEDRLRKRGHQIGGAIDSVTMPGGDETCLVVDGAPRSLADLRNLEQQESDME